MVMSKFFRLSFADVELLIVSLTSSYVRSKEVLRTTSDPLIKEIVFREAVDVATMLMRLSAFERSL